MTHVDRDDELRDEEFPDPDDLTDPWADEDTTPCEACGEPIHELVMRCPHCGYWQIGGSTAEQRSRSWLWPVVIGALVTLGMLGWRVLR